MLCHTWDHLYQQYESASIRRVQKKRREGFVVNAVELDHLNAKIAEALRKLKEHEKQHGCHS